MKNIRKVVSVTALVLAMGATSLTAFAASEYSTPAELLAALTGKTVESLSEERKEENKTYGKIALEEGKLDEFKEGILQIKKDNLAEQVAEGKITQEKADEIIEKLEENQATCDGTGGAQIGRTIGAKFGSNGKGLGNGGETRGQGLGRGQGAAGNGYNRAQGGRGMGMGGLRLQDGSSYTGNNN